MNSSSQITFTFLSVCFFACFVFTFLIFCFHLSLPPFLFAFGGQSLWTFFFSTLPSLIVCCCTLPVRCAVCFRPTAPLAHPPTRS
ncbi:hypothetical protein TCDM_11095 [Trypanosoma cruzi Dm28c]|uniref:Uncharacterized protein n=1 Tax=Trypanosoma cruzi Dm28c TaxID=1416333 RepID=V5B192_TRYCR|nr:hypothetical protein TCDM_11095 [Trypanosoma cruzi Dm28c]